MGSLYSVESENVECFVACLDNGKDVDCSVGMKSGNGACSVVDVNSAVSEGLGVCVECVFDVGAVKNVGKKVDKGSGVGDFSVVLECLVVCTERMRLSSVKDCVTFSGTSGNKDGFCVINVEKSAVKVPEPLI